jgi:hypothetical protein
MVRHQEVPRMDGNALRDAGMGEHELQSRRFLRRLYVATEGNYSAVRAVDVIASDVGVGTEVAFCIARDLARRGHVKWRGIGVVSVTAAGARGVIQHTRAERRRRLGDAVRARNVAAVGAELERLCEIATADPRYAVTAARSIVKTTLRACIAAENLAAPANHSIRELWRVVQPHLGLAPTPLLDDEVNRALRALSSIVNGIAGFASEPDGHSRAAAVDPLYARLAIRAASTVVMFVLEAWRARTKD